MTASDLVGKARVPIIQVVPHLGRTSESLCALTYAGPNKPPALKDVPKPELQNTTDALVKVKYSTICGTDLHILKGHVSTVSEGLVLGHEGVGTIEAVGAGVSSFKPGDPVLISCISACGTCEYCKRGMNSHCKVGGWNLGKTIDGTQADYVRIPNAENSLYQVPDGIDEKALVMLSDILPTGFECGVLNGKVAPGRTVAIVGSGPVGLASLLTARLYSPSVIVMVDGDANKLDAAKMLGATHTAGIEEGVEVARRATGGKGCDTVIEAVGTPASFHQCQELVAPGGVIANVGVHGVKVDLYLERLWDKNITITTKLVDTTATSMLLNLHAAGKLPVEKLITHEFKFDEINEAYEVFGKASANKALKVLLVF